MPTVTVPGKKIYNLRFWLLCLSAFLFITSFNMLVPELTEIIDYYKGSYQRSFPIVLFATAALLSRPFSGVLVDKIGRKPIIMIGTLICVVVSLFYQFADGLIVFLIVRFLHGFSAGFTPVGNTSYLADISPANRRGEAMGMLGMAATLGFPTGMFIGAWIAAHANWDVLFYASSLCAFISLAIVATFKETMAEAESFKLKHLKIKKEDIIDRAVWLPFIIMVLTIFSFGANTIVVFDHAQFVGFSVEYKAVFFLVYSATSVLVRYPAGKISDRWGRRNTMLSGIIFLIIGLYLLTMAKSPNAILFAGVVYGIATGINSPTIFAWAVDLSDKARVGRAMSTLFIAIELGVILGALVGGFFTSSNKFNYQPVHFTSFSLAAVAMTILLFTKPDIPPQQKVKED